MSKINSRYRYHEKRNTKLETIRVLIPFLELNYVLYAQLWKVWNQLCARSPRRVEACTFSVPSQRRGSRRRERVRRRPPSARLRRQNNNTPSASALHRTQHQRPTATMSSQLCRVLPTSLRLPLASAPVRLKQLHKGRRLKHLGVSPSVLQTFLLVYNLKKSGQIIQNFLHNLHLYSCRTDRNNIFIISNNSFYF